VLIEQEKSSWKTTQEARENEYVDFQEKVIRKKLEIESKFSPDELVIMDRGLHDILAYEAYLSGHGQEIVALFSQEKLDVQRLSQILGPKAKKLTGICQDRVYQAVFSLETICFEEDGIRVESAEDQQLIGNLCETVYKTFWYEVHQIPLFSSDKTTSIELRKDAILEKAKISKSV